MRWPHAALPTYPCPRARGGSGKSFNRLALRDARITWRADPMDESKIHIRTPLGEVLVRKSDLDPARWLHFPATGLKQYVLWVHPETGASIALLDFPEGSG